VRETNLIDMAKGTLKYSVLLPTYNEKENISIIIFLLVEMFEKQCVAI